ncbi:hypothetical protein L1049_020630 [Liquidambar formosana]|uniref:Protein yippee-like n=1 Tax=Liquidambar formosana TaxID=63359 RepID=A0AAP0S7G3_LIQFO
MAEFAGPQLYSCYNCRNHVSLHDDIVSKAFQGRNGRAFLFSHAMNIIVGPKEDRHLMTGLHTVADISCADCHEMLGWKYERAYEASQKYKEGKFILEKSKIVKENYPGARVGHGKTWFNRDALLESMVKLYSIFRIIYIYI